ncbi:N-acetylmuramate alpha-1-phosphate uridylyltransferase MurU [Rhodocyclus tenuis]|uniref:MurNAc alpha-1-phosphate uridylyltransferase n=1 Tax=Rhodocyclus tenuis TaxID=1066 RepID=A0A840G1E6_RHOTE|nr:nucleotidyltransferase family protein [Rhodocyclus tenuis]MBB4245765.1 MurNAc alpha-1-phosphate uridylyltransferase [Rhodocyclus tenuis]
MKTLIFAAGRGERMRPLTDTTPKPLLVAGGKPLIVWHLERLAAAGLTEVVINCAHLADKLEAALGDGSAFGVAIRWSREPAGALETAGGIAWALPLLGAEPFLVINGDVWCDWDVARAPAIGNALATRGHDAHLLMVDNPQQHPGGDFLLADKALRFARDAAPTLRASDRGTTAETLLPAAPGTLTYAGIGVFSPALVSGVERGAVMKLRPLLDAAIAAGRLGGERHTGRWVDVGTPERLAELDRALRTSLASAAGA